MVLQGEQPAPRWGQGKLQDHLTGLFVDPDLIVDIFKAWRCEWMSWADFMVIANCVCKVMQFDPSMDGADNPVLLRRWLYMHNDAFWAPADARDVWEHLQYIYDKYMTKPETQEDMWRQGLEYVRKHPAKKVVSWTAWDLIHTHLRGSGRVSYAAQDRMIDEVLDEFDKLNVDKPSEVFLPRGTS